MIKRGIYLLAMLLIVSCSSNKKQSSSAESQADSQTSSTSSALSDSLQQARAVEQATFTDLDGNPVSISEFEGKVVLIDFWETWCQPCIASFKTMQQLMEDYPEQFVVLAVTPGFTDTVEDARKFARNHDYDFVYLYDENKLHQKLNVMGIPFKVFVGPEGNFIEKSMGSKGPKGDYKHAEDIIQEHS